MTERPLISIITVNLNDVNGLRRTLKSVFEQTWQEFEFIVIDGGSSDGSKDLIESHKQRIDRWVSEPDGGIYSAMNKGIKMASGEYLIFVNSGDELYSNNVFEFNKHLIHTDDLLYGNIAMVSENKIRVHCFSEILNYRNLIYGWLGHGSTFIKRNLFEKVGNYDENYRIVSDWEFFIKAILKYNCSTRKIDNVILKAYMDGISVSNPELVKLERRRVLELHYRDYVRLIELEKFLKNIQASKTINIVRKLGFLKFINRIS